MSFFLCMKIIKPYCSKLFTFIFSVVASNFQKVNIRWTNAEICILDDFTTSSAKF